MSNFVISHPGKARRQKTRKYGKAGLAFTFFITLSSCSLVYELDVAFTRNGLIITPYELGIFGGKGEPGAKVQSLRVERLSRDPRISWEIRSPDYNGTKLVSITYGDVPKGLSQKVAPVPFEAGQLYLVTINALGGHGSKYFVFSPYAGYTEDPQVTFLDARMLPSEDDTKRPPRPSKRSNSSQ